MSDTQIERVYKRDFKSIADELEAVVENYVSFYEDLERDDYFNEYAENQISEVTCNLLSIFTMQGWKVEIKHFAGRNLLVISKHVKQNIIGIITNSSEMRFTIIDPYGDYMRLEFCNWCQVDTFLEYPLFTSLLQSYLAKIDKYRNL